MFFSFLSLAVVLTTTPHPKTKPPQKKKRLKKGRKLLITIFLLLCFLSFMFPFELPFGTWLVICLGLVILIWNFCNWLGIWICYSVLCCTRMVVINSLVEMKNRGLLDNHGAGWTLFNQLCGIKEHGWNWSILDFHQ